MSRISDVLRSKGSAVATIPPEAAVSELLALLAEHNIGAAVVVSDDGIDQRVVGMVSERDVVRQVHRQRSALLGTSVAEIMSTTVTTCEPQDDLVDVLRLMTERRFRHIPVLVDGQLGGLVSIGDIVKHRIGELEEERAHLHSYLAAGS
jgi:CBS domain-containing protein